MTCPDKYLFSSSFREITTDISPDFDFSYIKHVYKGLGPTDFYTQA
jgi:hypothetical protein